MRQPTQEAPIHVRHRLDFDDGPGVRASSGAVHHEGWTEFPTRWIHDRRLTIDARGLLACLASYSDHELPTVEELEQVNASDRQEIESFLDELDRVGYLVRHRDGRLGIRDASLLAVA